VNLTVKENVNQDLQPSTTNVSIKIVVTIAVILCLAFPLLVPSKEKSRGQPNVKNDDFHHLQSPFREYN